MNGQVNFKCPHCGINNTILVEVTTYSKLTTVLCELEDGGCDEYSVIRTIFEPTVKVFTLTPAQETK